MESIVEALQTFQAMPAFPFLVVCPLVFIAGFIDAIAGGGGLISLPAFLIAGLPSHVALGTNKLSSCMGTALATWRYAQKGYINVRRSAVCAAVALVGSVAGAKLVLMIDDGAFKIVMLVIVPLVALYVLTHKALDEVDGDPLPARTTLVICAASSLAIGVYDGFFGPGTGTFLMLAFMRLARLKVSEAAGTCKVVNLTTNIAALAVFLTSGVTWVALGFTAGLFNMAGAWLGVNFFVGKGIRAVRPIMLVVLAIFFVKLLVDILG